MSAVQRRSPPVSVVAAVFAAVFAVAPPSAVAPVFAVASAAAVPPVPVVAAVFAVASASAVPSASGGAGAAVRESGPLDTISAYWWRIPTGTRGPAPASDDPVQLREDLMEILGLASVPSHTEELRRLSDTAWPAFLLHGDVRGWDSLFDDFAEFQTVLVESGELVGAGLAAPCPWRVGDPLPESIDAALARAEWPLPAGSGVLLALAAFVVPAHRGRGFSRDIIRAMRALATREGLAGVLAPVRPTRKHEFPDMSIEEYADWRRDGAGRLVDPWLRVHEELGGLRLGFAARALTVRGTLGEWESWTGLHFDESGPHPVPGALVPVQIDRECDLGEYVEPNVWYVHAGDALGR